MSISYPTVPVALRRCMVLAVVAIALGVIGLGPSSGAAQGVVGRGAWHVLSPAGSRFSGAGSVLPDGRVIFVGSDAGGARAGLYAPASDTWQTVAVQTVITTVTSVTALADGRVLVVGGGQAAVYDAVTDSWQRTGQPTATGGDGATVALADGRVLIAGGTGGGPPTGFCPAMVAAAELYDPGTGIWTRTGDMTVARWGATATVLADGRVLVVGGGNGNATCPGPFRTVEVYDPATGRWSKTADLPVNSGAGHSATLLQDGRVLVVWVGTALLFDPVGGTWSKAAAPAALYGHFSHTATLLPDGRVLVAGGFAPRTFLVSASAEVYDPGTDSWSGTDPMHRARDGAFATLLPTGTVLVAGGDDERTGEVFDLAAPSVFPVRGMVRGDAGDSCTNVRERPEGQVIRCLPPGTILQVSAGFGTWQYLSWRQLVDGTWIAVPYIWLQPPPAADLQSAIQAWVELNWGRRFAGDCRTANAPYGQHIGEICGGSAGPEADGSYRVGLGPVAADGGAIVTFRQVAGLWTATAVEDVIL